MNNYIIFCCFIIQIKLVNLYKSQLLLVFKNLSDKSDNIMELVNIDLFLSNIKLFLNIYNSSNFIPLYNK